MLTPLSIFFQALFLMSMQTARFPGYVVCKSILLRLASHSKLLPTPHKCSLRSGDFLRHKVNDANFPTTDWSTFQIIYQRLPVGLLCAGTVQGTREREISKKGSSCCQRACSLVEQTVDK